jgi:hypothetical protein
MSLVFGFVIILCGTKLKIVPVQISSNVIDGNLFLGVVGVLERRRTGPGANPIQQQKCANKERKNSVERIAH